MDTATLFSKKAEELKAEKEANSVAAAAIAANTSTEKKEIVDEKKPEIVDHTKHIPEEGKKEPTAEEKVALEAKAKVDAENKVIEDKKRNELLEQSIPDYLKEKTPETPANGKKDEKTDTTTNKELQEEREKIRREYEEKYGIYENDILVKSIAEWRKSGGDDINEFLKETGMVDVKKVPVSDMFKEQGKELELAGEDLDEYVKDKMDEYGEMKIGKKKETEKTLREQYGNKVTERANNYIAKSSQSRVDESKKQKEYVDYALAELKTKSKLLKEYNGLPIDEKIKEDILKIAPSYATPIHDKEKGFLGYDVDAGIRTAILLKFEKELLKANYTNGYTSGFDAAMSQRSRISSNMQSQGLSAKNGEDNLADAKNKFLKK